MVSSLAAVPALRAEGAFWLRGVFHSLTLALTAGRLLSGRLCPAGVISVIRSARAVFNLIVDQRGHVGCAVAVVDVYHGHSRSATVEHGKKGGDAAKVDTITDACWHRDHRRLGQPGHDRCEGAFHAGDDDDHVSLLQCGDVREKTVEAGHAHIGDFVGVMSHQPKR